LYEIYKASLINYESQPFWIVTYSLNSGYKCEAISSYKRIFKIELDTTHIL